MNRFSHALYCVAKNVECDIGGGTFEAQAAYNETSFMFTWHQQTGPCLITTVVLEKTRFASHMRDSTCTCMYM